MKKTALLLVLIMLVSSCLCACNLQEPDYSDGDGTSELISMENKKVSDDDIEFQVISVDGDEHNRVKTYKKSYTAEDFAVKFEKVKVSDAVYVPEEELAVRYPEKVLLPEYDVDALGAIALAAYAEKYGPLAENTYFISKPKFTTRTFTGKLVASFTVYTEPTVDESGVTCYGAAKRVRLTGDLYTYEIEE